MDDTGNTRGPRSSVERAAQRFRVLFVAPLPPPMGGVEHAMAQLLASTLGDRCAITHVDSRLRRHNAQRGYLDIAAVTGLARVWFRMVWAIARVRPHVVYYPLSSNTTGFGRDGVLIVTAWVLRQRVVAHYRGGNFHNFYRHASPLAKVAIRRVLRCLAELVVLGTAIRDNFAGAWPEGRPIRVIGNGIAQATAAPRRPPAEGGGCCRLLFVGNLSFVKGFHDLVLAYRTLLADGCPVRLLCAGEVITVQQERNILASQLVGVDQERLRTSDEDIRSFLRDAEKLGITHAGVVHGPDKERLFAEADVFVLPSYSEGFSMAVLEAMAAGLPVVTTNVGAMADVVAQGSNGYVLQPGDWQGLAQHLALLSRDASLRNSMGERSAIRARTHFSIERVADSLYRLFVEVACAPFDARPSVEASRS